MVDGEDGARLKNQAQECCEYVKREGGASSALSGKFDAHPG